MMLISGEDEGLKVFTISLPLLPLRGGVYSPAHPPLNRGWLYDKLWPSECFRGTLSLSFKEFRSFCFHTSGILLPCEKSQASLLEEERQHEQQKGRSNHSSWGPSMWVRPSRNPPHRMITKEVSKGTLFKLPTSRIVRIYIVAVYTQQLLNFGVVAIDNW